MQLGYLNNVSIARNFAKNCANFRSGSGSAKSIDGLDINGLFADVYVRCYPSKIMDINKGETAEYVASIVQSFRVPTAN